MSRSMFTVKLLSIICIGVGRSALRLRFWPWDVNDVYFPIVKLAFIGTKSVWPWSATTGTWFVVE